MAFEDRRKIFERIEELRGGRTLVCFFNFDRESSPLLPGLTTQFYADVKEPLFRVLKESGVTKGIDLCVHTRGGDINSVWPLVSLLREFDQDFEVLVPFRCHSSGTLLALGANRIVLGPLSELSPIDPTTGNQFNPVDPVNPTQRMAIAVEDVNAFRKFVLEQFGLPSDAKDALPKESIERLAQCLDRLMSQVHPLALGNVHRVHAQIKVLAANLLGLRSPGAENKFDNVVKSLTSRFYSHLHMINRHEAKEILGERVVFAPDKVALALDDLLRSYEMSFDLRHPFLLFSHMGNKAEDDVRFVGGVVESKSWSYLNELSGHVRIHSRLPPNVQIQIPPGQPMPLVPGLPKESELEIVRQGWYFNKEPKGVTK
jgi:hypothetical protein